MNVDEKVKVDYFYSIFIHTSGLVVQPHYTEDIHMSACGCTHTQTIRV